MVFTIIFHQFTIDFDAVSIENGLKNNCFCHVLQLFSPYSDVVWKNLHGLAKNHQKHMGFSSISPYFDLILTLF